MTRIMRCDRCGAECGVGVDQRLPRQDAALDSLRGEGKQTFRWQELDSHHLCPKCVRRALEREAK